MDYVTTAAHRLPFAGFFWQKSRMKTLFDACLQHISLLYLPGHSEHFQLVTSTNMTEDFSPKATVLRFAVA